MLQVTHIFLGSIQSNGTIKLQIPAAPVIALAALCLHILWCNDFVALTDLAEFFLT